MYEGDRIIVGTLGATAAVAGKVARPAIFELAPGTNAISVRALLDLGGGMLRQGSRMQCYRFTNALQAVHLEDAGTRPATNVPGNLPGNTAADARPRCLQVFDTNPYLLPFVLERRRRP